jgi:transposase InsO family protein
MIRPEEEARGGGPRRRPEEEAQQGGPARRPSKEAQQGGPGPNRRPGPASRPNRGGSGTRPGDQTWRPDSVSGFDDDLVRRPGPTTRLGDLVRRAGPTNGACYRSHLWRDSLRAAGITHKRTRPYRPQTNGKVERYNRTLLEEWTYAQPYRIRTRTPPSTPAMAPHLQSPPRPHRTRRPTTHQPHGTVQLGPTTGLTTWADD